MRLYQHFKPRRTTMARKATVTLTVNEYDIPMLEIQGKPRNTWISVKKAMAILATNDDPSLIEPVQKHGRELFKISYGDGKSFTVGQVKIESVLNNAKFIEKAIA